MVSRTATIATVVLSRVLACWAGGSAVSAADKEPDTGKVDAKKAEFFESKIRPLLLARCGTCHGAKKQEGKQRVCPGETTKAVVGRESPLGYICTFSVVFTWTTTTSSLLAAWMSISHRRPGSSCPLDKALIESLGDSQTALICNALTALGYSEPHTYALDGRIQCMTPDLPPLVGEAITIKIDTCTPEGGPATDEYHEMMEVIEASELPRVIMVETIGPDPCRECVMGDGMAKGFMAAGAIGLVTSGGVRDLPGIIDQGFSVFAIARVIQHAALRWSDYGEPAQVGGISVKTGDLIHGDSGGCVVIPEPNHQHIVEACQLVNDFEKQAHVMIRRTDLNNAQKRARMDKLSATFDRAFTPLR